MRQATPRLEIPSIRSLLHPLIPQPPHCHPVGLSQTEVAPLGIYAGPDRFLPPFDPSSSRIHSRFSSSSGVLTGYSFPVRGQFYPGPTSASGEKRVVIGFLRWHGSRGLSTEVGHRLSERMDMYDRRSGFSIIELVVVLMVGSVLTSIAITNFNGVSGRFAVKGAQQTLMSMHARARVQAVEYGRTVRLHVDPAGDSIWLSRDSEVLDVMDFGEEFNVGPSGRQLTCPQERYHILC